MNELINIDQFIKNKFIDLFHSLWELRFHLLLVISYLTYLDRVVFGLIEREWK